MGAPGSSWRLGALCCAARPIACDSMLIDPMATGPLSREGLTLGTALATMVASSGRLWYIMRGYCGMAASSRWRDVKPWHRTKFWRSPSVSWWRLSDRMPRASVGCSKFPEAARTSKGNNWVPGAATRSSDAVDSSSSPRTRLSGDGGAAGCAGCVTGVCCRRGSTSRMTGSPVSRRGEAVLNTEVVLVQAALNASHGPFRCSSLLTIGGRAGLGATGGCGG